MKRTSYYRNVLEGKCTGDFPIIDNHGHLAAEKFSTLPLEKEVVEIVEVLNAVGIDRAVVFPHHSDYRRGNDMILEGISLAPERLIGYATLVRDNTSVMLKELERCRSHGMRGLKLHSSFGGDFAERTWKDVWAYCAQYKWPVIIHGMIPELARENPETVFIHAHGIEAIFNEYAIKTMQECPNYYWDTSSTVTAMGAMERAVSLFGSDRLIYGSDLPGNNPATRLGAVLGARITEEDMRRILGGNIIRLLGLKMRDKFPR